MYMEFVLGITPQGYLSEGVCIYLCCASLFINLRAMSILDECECQGNFRNILNTLASNLGLLTV